MSRERLGASFRDPSGFVFVSEGTVFRQIDHSYAGHYDRLMSGGLYAALVERGWLVPHTEAEGPSAHAHRIIRPERVPYISYPYEWCFSQLKDAALLTLDIQRLSLAHDMVLKDASAFNVQFIGSRPVFVDTLSFEAYVDGAPWVAYRQFCEHFLGPLALMSLRDLRLRELSSRFIDGLPLDLVASLLPVRSRLRYGLLAHIHLHAASQRRHRDAAVKPTPRTVPRLPKPRLLALTASLEATVRSCTLPAQSTEWSRYYEQTNYSSEAMAAKEHLVVGLVNETAEPAGIVHDIGANTGRFSRLIAGERRYVVSHDLDDLAVEAGYAEARRTTPDQVLPLVLNLVNPSPPIGWALRERTSALDRIRGGTVVALALVHHLAISNNVPLPQVAELFAGMAHDLIIEFVPKQDSQVLRLLETRTDIFPDYTVEAFEHAFGRLFGIERRHAVPGTQRTLYLMRRRA